MLQYVVLTHEWKFFQIDGMTSDTNPNISGRLQHHTRSQFASWDSTFGRLAFFDNGTDGDDRDDGNR